MWENVYNNNDIIEYLLSGNNFFERKGWNRGFGTETPIPDPSIRKKTNGKIRIVANAEINE
jgi:hypothetical protein